MSTNVYEQTLRVDGVRQREINIENPPFPNPGSDGTVSATNSYVLGDIQLERIHRFSTAIDRTISPKLRASLSFSTARYNNQLRGVNLNAPVRGERPDPEFANIIEVTSDASLETYELVPDFSVNFAGGIRNADQAKWNPKRTTLRFNYRHRRAYNNTDGAFSVSPSGSLDDQWGPAGGDTRHRMRASVSTQAYRNLNAQMSWDANSGSPYTITTGIDENGDSIFNDRPLNLPRNSAAALAFDVVGQRVGRFRSAKRRDPKRAGRSRRATGPGGRPEAAVAGRRRTSEGSASTCRRRTSRTATTTRASAV
jgi:hypothetical protein